MNFNGNSLYQDKEKNIEENSSSKETNNISNLSYKEDIINNSLKGFLNEVKCEIQNKCDENKNLLTKNHNEKEDGKIKHSLKYRADIDGLRTIAISIVVIFHAWPKILFGGFVGVDVFFVISGFLISSIIFKEYETNKFSYVNFYYRRIKRLFPALIFMLIVVILIAYFQLWDNEIKSLSKTIIAGSLFGANLQILFLKKGYFDADTQENPLLHLWSLGVEEQFYIIWPLIASLLIKTSPFKSYLMASIFFFVSFLGNILAVFIYPKWAYYFPLCRFWEMAIGGFIALMNHHNKDDLKESNGFDDLFSILGLFLIIISSFIINENSLFPGFWAILPTIGTALMISSRNGFFNRYLLSTKLFIFIGKISYPLYLFHWPLLVFGKIFFNNSPTIKYPVAIVVVISIFLSIFTYYLIEQPINNLKNKTRLIVLLSTAMSFILIIGILFYLNPIYFSQTAYFRKNLDMKYKIDKSHSEKFFPDNFSKNNFYYFKNQTSRDKLIMTMYRDEDSLYERLIPINKTSEHYTYLGKSQNYLFNYKKENKKVVVIGDSFAEMIFFRIKHLHDSKLIKNFPTVVFKVVSGSWIAFPCNDDEIILNNLRAHNEIIEYIKKEKPMSVFFCTKPYSGTYPEMIDDNEAPDAKNNCNIVSNKFPKKFSKNKVEDLFKKLVKNLKSLTNLGIRVYMNTFKPEGDLYNPKIMFNNFGVIEDRIQPVNYSEYMNKYQKFKDIVDKAIIDSRAIKIDFSDNMCKDNLCPVIDAKGYSVNRDYTHFSGYFVQEHLSVLDQIFMDDNL